MNVVDFIGIVGLCVYCGNYVIGFNGYVLEIFRYGDCGFKGKIVCGYYLFGGIDLEMIVVGVIYWFVWY